MLKILFQGDSVTDCGRARDCKIPNNGLGTGYVNLIAARLNCDRPDVEIWNRGVGGNRITDMYARWIEDTLNLDFDILSILNGINDIGFQLRLGRGANREKFAFVYDRMLQEVEESHPNAKLVLMEPFLFQCDLGPNDGNGNDIFVNYSTWYSEIRARGNIVKQLAEKHKAIFVPLADEFDALSKKFGAKQWSADCIHPMSAGHEVIARRWLECCSDLLK